MLQDSRQLLREENFRKLVSREFPKLTEDLKEVLQYVHLFWGTGSGL